jgi:hypothetical protein
VIGQWTHALAAPGGEDHCGFNFNVHDLMNQRLSHRLIGHLLLKEQKQGARNDLQTAG